MRGILGLMTNSSGKVLCTCYADCVPLLFFDPVKNVIASVHSGWKGTIKLIGQETVFNMVNEYGSKVEDILVGIGPSIGPCCFEVQEDTYEQFRKAIFNKKYFSYIKRIEKRMLGGCNFG